MLPSSIINTAQLPFIELITVDSTNNYAMQQLQSGEVQHGMAWFAHSQTAGKGQRGRQWHAQAGQNITMSVVLHIKGLAVSSQFYLSAAIALAGHDLYSRYAGSESCVKWPNDIYWNDRKAGGILIENVLRRDNWQWAVAGTGININQTAFSDNAGRAVSLKQITGKNFEVIELAKELRGYELARYEQLLNDKDSILRDYNEVLYKKDCRVRLKKENIAFEAVIKEALPDGRLRVEGAAWEYFNFGEVEWVI